MDSMPTHEEKTRLREEHWCTNKVVGKQAISNTSLPHAPISCPSTKHLTHQELKEWKVKGLCWNCDESGIKDIVVGRAAGQALDDFPNGRSRRH